MKIKGIIYALGLCGVLLFSTNANAYCEGVTRIVVDPINNIFTYRSDFQNALDNFDLEAPTNGRYEICFDFTQLIDVYDPNPLEDGHFITFPDENYTGSLDIVISGVRMKQTGGPALPLFMIDGSLLNGHKVILEDFEMTNATNGFEIVDALVEIIKPLIAGDTTGSCIDLNGADGSIITAGDISACDTGILIQNTSNARIGAADAGGYENDKNDIHGNDIGIHLVSGDFNSWAYNSIYANNVDPMVQTSADGIVVDSGANESLLPPQMELQDGKMLKCEEKSDGSIIRKLQFDPMDQEGTVTLYLIDSYEQGETYVNQCHLGVDGICELGDLPAGVLIDENQCGQSGLYLQMLFTGKNSSSTEYADDLLDFGSYVVFAGGVITQTTDSPEAAEESIEDAVGGSGASGEGGGVEIGAASVAAGCGGGASLIPHDISKTVAPHMGLWWIIFSTITLIGGMRLQRAYIRRRRK